MPEASSIIDALASVEAAVDPFPGLTETAVSVGDERLRVVLADAQDERSQGLRRRETLGPYDGMLFVYPEPVQTSFTMSTVPVALDIAFYDGAGRVVTTLRMEPCPGSQSSCPLYSPEAEFVYALETLADDLPKGRLTGG